MTMDEREALFALLRCALRQEQCASLGLEATEWWHLFRVAQQNRVAALVADVLPAGVPREVLMPWLAEREKVASRHRYQQRVQRELTDVMQRHGIDTLVLKGTVTARHYLVPELREFGDLDLYFYDRHDEADRVAAAELRVDVSSDGHHHSKYLFRGITIESHRTLFNTHYPPSNKQYEALLEGLLASHSLPTFEVLYLLRHAACHFAAGRLVARDLCDWALTCHALQGAVDWQLVQQVVDDYGMWAFVEPLNTLSHDKLGIAIPLRTRCRNEWLERDLIYGNIPDHPADGLSRIVWKVRRWRANTWKRRMVFRESDLRLLAASLVTHALKPHSILHKV